MRVHSRPLAGCGHAPGFKKQNRRSPRLTVLTSPHFILVHYIVSCTGIPLGCTLHYKMCTLCVYMLLFFFQPLVIRKSLIAYYGHSLNLKKFYWLYHTHSTLKEKLALVDSRWVSLTWYQPIKFIFFLDVCTCSIKKQSFENKTTIKNLWLW